MLDLSTIKKQLFEGQELTEEQAYGLLDCDLDSLLALAAEVTSHFCSRAFDSCSIINVRSGRCPEDCKWCAQSAHYATGCATYGVLPEHECVASARANADQGVKRFSLVASGKAVAGREFDQVCQRLSAIQRQVPIKLCASLGLIDGERMQRLKDSGVRRYHCNLETAPSHFVTLCSTHTIDDKLRTIETAHQAGMQVCSGGIIGMGETPRQRVEFALTLRRAKPCSIPINILSPIPGTPLQDTAPITDDEILQTIAIFRLVHPQVALRFAGGRARLSREMQIKAMRIGINGGIVGDLLTTVASNVSQDQKLVSEAGYEF